MSERKLATIDTISDLRQIPGADAIECATVRGWNVVVKKDEFKVGDQCVYIEIDSLLPLDNPHFGFLRRRGDDKSTQFRLRTVKLRGQISQGIAFPVSILNNETPQNGDDVTQSLGITKYEPYTPVVLSGIVKGNFPSFIPKTGEDRIQNVYGRIQKYSNHIFYMTEKLDGTSATFYHNYGKFGVCSRNLELQNDDNNLYWKMARELDLERTLPGTRMNIAIQGEIIGPGVQKNRLHRENVEFYAFRAYDIDNNKALGFDEFISVTDALCINRVPILGVDLYAERSRYELIALAVRNSVLSTKDKAEGIVFRTINQEPYISFKSINNEYLLKHGE